MAEVAISIVMPVYNVAPYLRAALDSVFRQTWQDFELLIIDDGSTDDTRAILADLRDPRIHVIHQAHGGLADALRVGVDRARGRYLARMDGDDEALPHRLAAQKVHLDRSEKVVLVHSLAQPVDIEGRGLPMIFGEARPSAATKWLLLWRNPILHPTVMLRLDTLRAHALNYRLELFRADEFDLWNRLAPHGEFEAIPEVLLRYRLHPQSMTQRNPADLHSAAFARVIRENFERFEVPLAASAAEELAVISGGTWIDPITHRYRHLGESLPALQSALSRRFCSAFAVDPGQLAAVQAEQLVRWARYMLATSRGAAMRLLQQSVRRHSAIARTPLFWAVAAALALPAPLQRRLARRSARRAPISAQVG